MYGTIQGAGRAIGYAEPGPNTSLAQQAQQKQREWPRDAAEAPRSEFAQAREHCYMAMSTLSEALGELERRLGPVLMPVPMPAGATLGKNEPVPECSAVADALNGAATHAHAMRERVLGLLHALAV